MGKINFTPEHKASLDKLVLENLYNGTQFKGKVGTNMTIYDLLHNCTVNTISDLSVATKKQIKDFDEKNEWDLDDYQQRKKSALVKKQELLSLVEGYLRKQAEMAANTEKLRELRKTQKELKESLKTPPERLAELEAEIAQMESNGVVEV